MRVLLYTGKGGVGKTTVAAATAVRSAELGYRTIVLSTDAAHSLADSFDIPLANEPVAIAPNLWGQETEIFKTIETYWSDIRDWMSALMAWRGMEEIVADEMAVLPGMEELANLLYVTNYYHSGDYDVVIIDCAPTGETLRLLGFPEHLHWWMERMFPIGRTATSLVRPFVRPFLDLPLPDDKVFRSAERLFDELVRMHALLTDPEKSSVRLVVNAEKMVIKEAQRTFTYLNLYGYVTDMVICNRLIPDEVADRYFDSWKESQARHYGVIEECFSPLPILTASLMEQEVVGMDRLAAMAKAVYGEQDPTQVFFHGRTQGIEREDGHYVLTLSLPFVAKEDLSLTRNGDELIVQVGSYRRNILLPRTLAGLEVGEAKFEQEKLRIRFDQQKGK